MPEVDWPGLLKWSLKYSDGTAPRTQMCEEDREYLERAISGYLASVDDPCKVVSNSIVKISAELKRLEESEIFYDAADSGDEFHDAVSEARGKDGPKNFAAHKSTQNLSKQKNQHLQKTPNHDLLLGEITIIQRCVDEHPELSRTLQKLNAMDPLLALVKKWEVNSAEVVVLTLEIFAFVLQNNPLVQTEVERLNGLRIFLSIMEKNEKAMEQLEGERLKDRKVIQIKCLSAIAALIRQHKNLEKDFLSHNGLLLLVNSMRSQDPKLQEKSASLAKYLIGENLIGGDQATMAGLEKALLCLLPLRLSLQFSEIILSLTIVSLKHFRPLYARSSILDQIEDALKARKKMVSTSKDEDAAIEFEQIAEALKLCTFPRKKSGGKK